jgi:ABC-type amino acid transport substrate-binding protein
MDGYRRHPSGSFPARRSTLKRSWLILAVMLALVLALVPLAAACGDDDGEDTATDVTETTAGDTETTEGEGGETTEGEIEEPAAPEDPDLDADIEAVTQSEDIEMPPTVRPGVLQAGSDTAFPPFEFSDEQGGYVGFDVDMCTALAKKMGLELEVVPTAWDGIIPALVSDRFDIIMSAMTITEERQQQINFTDPYIQANIAITSLVDAPIESEEELEGKIVGVQVDTTGQFAVEEVEGVAEIRSYDTILSAFQDLAIGRLDAVVNDAPVNAYIIRDDPRFENTGEIVTDDVYGFGVKQGNDQLLEALNQALQELKDDGLYDRIFQKWFGDLPAESQ